MTFFEIEYDHISGQPCGYSFKHYVPESFIDDFNDRFMGRMYDPRSTIYEMKQFEDDWIQRHSNQR